MIFKRRDRDAEDSEQSEPQAIAPGNEDAVDPQAPDEVVGEESQPEPPVNRSSKFGWDEGDIVITTNVYKAPVADGMMEISPVGDDEEETPLLTSIDDLDDDEDDDDEVEAPGEVEPEMTGGKPVRPLPRILAVANQKGGVGKTTTTINLSAGLAELGYRVLVIDLDPQGNATTGLGIDARNFELSMYDVLMRDADLADVIEPTSTKNLFVAPATIDLAGVEIELVPAFSREQKLKRAVDQIIEDFDFILIDCPPSLGLITINGLAAATEVLVPIQCEYYALEGLGQLLRNVKLVASNLNPALEVTTIVLTMYDGRTKLAADVASEVRNHFPNEVCASVIPRTVRLSEAPSFGQPITSFDPSSRGARAYRNLAREVSNGATKRTR